MTKLNNSISQPSTSAQVQQPPSDEPKRISSAPNQSNELPSSWATTISHYLLTRRMQTQQAYQLQLQPERVAQETDLVPDWLFEALFAVLVQRLEEGHTVLVLSSDTDKRNGNDLYENASHATLEQGGYEQLLPWQKQLLQPLLNPLLSYVESQIPMIKTDTDIDVMPTVEALLERNSILWQKTLLQSTLSQYDQQILQQRYKVCRDLYQFLQQSATASSTCITNSLSILFQYIEENALFSKTKKENVSSVDRPIMYQIEIIENNNSLDDSLLNSVKITFWLHRTWQAEYTLAANIMRIKQEIVAQLPVTTNPELHPEQQDAINMANRSAFSIITGGPGTGKTFTVAQLVMALQSANNQDQSRTKNTTNSIYNANLALAAPTGKAAQRMQESLQQAIERAGIPMQLPEAKTIHRLLGIGQGGQPRYYADNPLSEDIIIVDEASMLGVELANHLVSAIKPKARLILLGDANQLAAVDAGAVLADLCRIPTLQDVHKKLENSRRFTDKSGIGQLAKFINQETKDMAAVWRLINNNDQLSFHALSHQSVPTTRLANYDQDNNGLSTIKLLNLLSKNYDEYLNQTKMSLQQKSDKSLSKEQLLDNVKTLMITLNRFRVLTAGHHGRCGDHYINRYLSAQHRSALKLPISNSEWYHGRPIMVLQNNYELGLFNGDIGICMQSERGQLQVFFENKSQGVATHMFSDEMITTAYAMTIHKSQGSEFDHVAICFDENNARLLSQELIYTAVTRAKAKVSIFSTEAAFTQALNTPTVRQTGLSLQFKALR